MGAWRIKSDLKIEEKTHFTPQTFTTTIPPHFTSPSHIPNLNQNEYLQLVSLATPTPVNLPMTQTK